MYASRPGITRERDLCAGPGRLCQALGLDGTFDGTDVVTGSDSVVLEGPSEPFIKP